MTVNSYQVVRACLDSEHLFSDWLQEEEGVTIGKKKRLTSCTHWTSGQCDPYTSVNRGSGVPRELLISNCCSGITIKDRGHLWEVRMLGATGSGSWSPALGKVPEGCGMTFSPVSCI